MFCYMCVVNLFRWCSYFMIVMLCMLFVMVVYKFMNDYVEIYGRVIGCIWFGNDCVDGLEDLFLNSVCWCLVDGIFVFIRFYKF